MCIHDATYYDLDCQFDVGHWTREGLLRDEFLPKLVAELHAIHKSIEESGIPYETIKYGPHERQEIYVWGDVSTAQTLLIYVHGGYWSAGTAKSGAFVAPNLLEHGIATAAIGFQLAGPEKRISEIVADNIEAVKIILDKWPLQRIVMCGYCSGAQIAVKVISSLRSPRLSHFLSLGGVFKVVEFVDAKLVERCKMTRDEAEEITCRPHEFPEGVRVHFIAAGLDSPIFKRQTLKYYEGVKECGIDATLEVVTGANHFDIGGRAAPGAAFINFCIDRSDSNI